jgi:copper chaperone CopZ
MRVESIEDNLAGIQKATASYHKRQLIVEFDEKKVTEEEILDALKNLGYQALPR